MLWSTAMSTDSKLNFLRVNVDGIVISGQGFMGEIVDSGTASSFSPQASAKVLVETSKVETSQTRGSSSDQGRRGSSSEVRLHSQQKKKPGIEEFEKWLFFHSLEPYRIKG